MTAYTRYGLGARGIDFIERVTSSTTVTAYPIYYTHGNMVATLQRSGTNSYTFGDQRSYDAWGKIRSGSGTGDPKGSYCANLGHKQDDESGLVYMRARYYEPASGRFISEDPAMDGSNWFVYVGSNPTNKADRTGRLGEYTALEALSILTTWTEALEMSPLFRSVSFSCLATVFDGYEFGQMLMPFGMGGRAVRTEPMDALNAVTIGSMPNLLPASSPTANIVGMCAGYAATIAAFLFMTGFDEVCLMN